MSGLLSEGHVVVQALGWTLLHYLWQGALIGLVYAALRPWLPSGRGRYGAALAALAALVLAPAFTLWQLVSSAAPTPVVIGAATQALPDVMAQAQSVSASWLPWIVGLWAIGVTALTARALLHWQQLQRMMRGASPMPEWQARLDALRQRFSIRRQVRLLWSERVDTPTLIGWLRPVILLPAAVALGFPAAQIEMILAHELGHVRRWDYAVNLIQVMLETVMFYHPVVHWISRELRHEREICCDDLVLRVSGGSPHVYARTLANLEDLRDVSGIALGVAASGGVLLDRVQRITGMLPKTTVAARPMARLMTLAGAGLVLAAGIAMQQFKPDSAVFTIPWRVAQFLTTGVSAVPRLSVANLLSVPEWTRPKLVSPEPVIEAPVTLEAPAIAIDSSTAMPLPSLAPPRTELASVIKPHLNIVTAPGTSADAPTLLPMVRASRAPQPMKMVQPFYPEGARERGVEGQVTVEFELGTNGDVIAARVVGAVPEKVFDSAALQALRGWRYDPATIRPGVHYQQNFVFSLGQNSVPKLEISEELNAESECRVVTGSRLCRRADGTEDAARTHGVDVFTLH